MATDPLDALRLTLMQDVLPVGLAAADRMRRGGPRELLAAFDGSSADPLGRLRQEGEPVASQLRDNLDRLQPGLGNPVMKVDVRDMADSTTAAPTTAAASGDDAGTDTDERAELQQALGRINARLDRLEILLAAAPPTL
ncbi:MAG: hypothetical protein VKN13_06005 [Cyanobacteriota bacterium]|nr:hypothetical protein [Cyanobacteriota bacterium]